jgi:hypothetical protein
MAVEIFDADFLVRSTLHDACNAHDVVTVTLVDLQPQSPFRMPAIDTRAAPVYSTGSVAISTLLRLKPDPRDMRRMRPDKCRDGLGSDATTPARPFLSNRRCRSLSASAIRPVRHSARLRFSMMQGPWVGLVIP